MKTTQKERRLYVRKGIVHLCYGGRFWAASDGAKTAITAKDRVVVEVDERPEEQALLITCGKAVEKWTLRTELDFERQSRSNTPTAAPMQPRSPGSEGYMVFLPPGSGGHKLGLPQVDAIEDAIDVARVAIEAFGVARELWEDCGWGQVVDRYDLQEVARVSYDGKLNMTGV